jgi:hypothetical protein
MQALIVALVMLTQVAFQTSSAPAAFESLSLQAEKARDSKHFGDAVALYKKARHMQPSWADGWWNLIAAWRLTKLLTGTHP